VSPLAAIARHYTRLDPRSLGLFRIVLGVALIADWAQRWEHRVAFYSNDGVLPNHAHIFHMKNEGRVAWSALHAFSTAGEAAVGLAFILAFYVLLTIGWKTRVFQVLSLVGMVSLAGRNTLTEGPGEALAIAILGVTLFLPLGTAFSVDAILGRVRLARETKAEQLLDRSTLHTDAELQQARLPGYSPHSIAAFGALALVSAVLLTNWKLQSGPAWRDGTALARALDVFMIASPAGFSMRDSSLLGPLTRVVHASQWLVPLLLLVPIARGASRGAAALLLVLYGSVYAWLTSYRLFGLCFVAMAALVLSQDTWERWLTRHDPRRARTVIFDVDCGICFWLSKVIRRWDSRRHLLFQGNGAFSSEEGAAPPELSLWDAKTASIVTREMPEGITAKLVEETVVVVRADGSFATRGAAIAEVMRALPGGALPAALLSLGPFATLRDRLYDAVARRRTAISVELGLSACGVAVMRRPVTLKVDVPPSRLLRFRVQAAAREALALIFVGAVLLQGLQANQIGPKISAKALEPVAWWTRATGHWALLAPEPPTTESQLVVDAQTREGGKIDLMTGQEATVSFDRPYRLGRQWAEYLVRSREAEQKEAAAGEREVVGPSKRRYFSRRGAKFEPAEQNAILGGADAFWITQPADGSGAPEVERLFRHARGGGVLNPSIAPLIKTPVQSRPAGKEPPRREPDLQDPPPEEPAQEQRLRFPESPSQE
jgi:predicted DCC family thiol-disulfide oxidoreductase YuxK